MSSISDRIERMIKEMLVHGNGEVLIVRNEMANRINVVPSQISYVLATRFTNTQGYLTESRRGGGGGIVLKRVIDCDETNYLMHAANAIGETLRFAEAKVLLQNFVDYEVIDDNTANLLASAISNNALVDIDPVDRNVVRATIVKNMLAALAAQQGENHAV